MKTKVFSNIKAMHPAYEWAAECRDLVEEFFEDDWNSLKMEEFIKKIQHDTLLAALQLSDDIGAGLIIKLMREHGLEKGIEIEEPKS